MHAKVNHQRDFVVETCMFTINFAMVMIKMVMNKKYIWMRKKSSKY